ncbi:MAG TPA: DUF1631 family protein [Burkholderiaceae bacterium]|nr:DUF1631 family protein [Burkholderiaceae bacterium]
MKHPSEPFVALAHATRQRFCSQAGLILPKVVQAAQDDLTQQITDAMSAREAQSLRDTVAEFNRQAPVWIDNLRAALQRQLASLGKDTGPDTLHTQTLELMAEEAVEVQLMASRLGARIQEVAGQALTDLRVRLLFAEGRTELFPQDPVKSDVLAQLFLSEWVQAGLSANQWKLLQRVMLSTIPKQLHDAYIEGNRFLVTNGVMPTIDLRQAMRRQPSSGRADASPTSSSGALDPSPNSMPPLAQGPIGNRERSPEWLSWARDRGQDVLQRIRRVFDEQLPTTARAASSTPPQVSPHLKALLDEAPTVRFAQMPSTGTPAVGAPGMEAVPVDMERYIQWVRQQSNQLKQATDSPSEKATIEVVALMFQSILTEDRLKPTLRVWFARLQIPVLRVALAEPDFFSSLQHPARRLIDRMGSCALGFDASLSDDDSAKALEAEIRRVVQVIEQYPETGRRVFQLVYDEFQHFLANHLQKRGQAGKLVSVAQQVELKETLTVQYTIELRKQLDNMPVREVIREFLFKVWAEVLAVAHVKHDPQHEVMVLLKQTASDLLWAASAKPTRAERSQVIAQLPNLLSRLRKGMGLLGIEADEQNEHIKRISDTLADAFMSRTETIPPEQLAAVTRNLSSLEDFLPQEDTADLELDQDSIEMITGVDASNIEIITHGGQTPGEAVRAWAKELQLGAWFTLDHNGHIAQVQLAWRSDRGQLCLFATAQQRYFLIQTTRMASYLQAGLLVPAEEESLTVRATRAALEKLDANPERLLA